MAAGSYNILEPKLSEQIGQAFPGGKLEFSAGSPVSLYQTTSFLFVAAIMIIILVAAVEYMIAGVWRIQASQASITKSDKQIRRVTVGLVGVLSLIVIIFTLNKGLAKGDVGFEGLRRSDRGSGGLAAVVPGQRATTTPSSRTNPPIPANNDDPAGWGAIRDDAAMRAQLNALPNGGITVNKTVCINPTQTSCTTVGGWDPRTPAMLAQLRNACPGRIQVTGGTEAGHRSHGPGRTSVDISLLTDDSVTNCIRSFPKASDLSFCYKTYSNFGFIFCDEISSDRHWHIQ